MITLLFSIDVKKQALSGLFFFYPDLSLFLCNRFGKEHYQAAWTKEILYLWICAAFPTALTDILQVGG